MTHSKEKKWENIIRKMERLLRLKSFPVGLKLLSSKEELSKIPFLRRPEAPATLCQLINLVRNFDWTVGATASDFLTPVCPGVVGLSEVPPLYKDGTFRSIVWVKNRAQGQIFDAAIPRIPFGKYEALAMAPLVYDPFEPDMVLIYANPAQMILLINALQFEKYEVMKFFCVGESSCSDVIGRCYLENKPALSIPCYGERRYGHAQDDELAMALPPSYMETALAGLEILYRRGVRYPISFSGAQGDLSSSFPPAYLSMDKVMKKVRTTTKGPVLGLTGGIATGKSTVSNMLREKGAYIIDFDLLARQVVEPGKPAYEDIVAYFGKQVLAPDKTLDRKAMSDIVFADMEKRKKLESFTHPRIYDEFYRHLEVSAQKDPHAPVVADIPLLFELNLQYLFDAVILVYTSPETQIQRVMERDKITEEEAGRIIGAQLSLAEKRRLADTIIENEGDLDQTRAQVDAVLETAAKPA